MSGNLLGRKFCVSQSSRQGSFVSANLVGREFCVSQSSRQGVLCQPI